MAAKGRTQFTRGHQDRCNSIDGELEPGLETGAFQTLTYQIPANSNVGGEQVLGFQDGKHLSDVRTGRAF